MYSGYKDWGSCHENSYSRFAIHDRRNRNSIAYPRGYTYFATWIYDGAKKWSFNLIEICGRWKSKFIKRNEIANKIWILTAQSKEAVPLYLSLSLSLSASLTLCFSFPIRTHVNHLPWLRLNAKFTAASRIPSPMLESQTVYAQQTAVSGPPSQYL